MKKATSQKSIKTGRNKSHTKQSPQNTSITNYTVHKDKCKDSQNGLDETNTSLSSWNRTGKLSHKLDSPMKLRSRSVSVAKSRINKDSTQTSLLDGFCAYRGRKKPVATTDVEGLIKQLRINEKMGLESHHLEEKGRAVFANQDFKTGDYICEYVGSLISYKEALKRETEYSEDILNGCYMYYFNHRGAKYCIDATQETEDMGRLINHSRIKFNMKSRILEGKNIHLCFFATRNITEGEELLYDYGDKSRESVKNFPWLKT